jgi:hypothetical protein
VARGREVKVLLIALITIATFALALLELWAFWAVGELDDSLRDKRVDEVGAPNGPLAPGSCCAGRREHGRSAQDTPALLPYGQPGLGSHSKRRNRGTRTGRAAGANP